MSIEQFSSNGLNLITKGDITTIGCAVLASASSYIGPITSKVTVFTYAFGHGAYHATNVFYELESKSLLDGASMFAKASTLWSAVKAIAQGIIVAKMDFSAANIAIAMTSKEGIEHINKIILETQNYVFSILEQAEDGFKSIAQIFAGYLNIETLPIDIIEKANASFAELTGENSVMHSLYVDNSLMTA